MHVDNPVTIDNYDSLYGQVLSFLITQRDRDIFKLDSVFLSLNKISYPSVEYLLKNNYNFSSMLLKPE